MTPSASPSRPDPQTSVCPGTLWVVATPLGNLDDFSPRASRVLAEADVIAAEDTRTSRKLLPAREKPPRWVALHDHNEVRVADALIEMLIEGLDVALVSDAGTPLISDPGYRLVERAHAKEIRVSPVPGPCAAIAAVSAAGLPSDRFCFEGFLPARSGQRRKRLDALAETTATTIFYVPARDLVAVLEDASESFGLDRMAAIGRELTKRFETVRRDRLEALTGWVAGDPDQQRGEAILLIAGAPQALPSTRLDAGLLARELGAELPPARAARLLVRICGMDRREAFALVESTRGEETGG